MRKRRQKPRVLRRRVVVKRCGLADEDDPLFEERELEICGAGDEKMTPAEK